MKTRTNIKISANVKAIEWLKSEILSELSNLFKGLAKTDEPNSYNTIADTIASIIAMSYTLARRLGISYANIDSKIEALTDIAERNSHELESEFSDMSELNKYIKNRR
ncbi:MAG: MazG-like family protein [Clostridia bacterium]|nr:MazG-like family protein [Clostridia bacterium]